MQAPIPTMTVGPHVSPPEAFLNLPTMRLLITLTLLTLILGGCRHTPADVLPDNLRATLDAEIAGAERYSQLKERRLDSLKNVLGRPLTPRQRLATTNEVITEYEAYKADSALYYINLNLASPVAEADSLVRARLLLKKADIYSHAGIFSDALELMHSIDPDSLSSAEREQYFSNYYSLYQYMLEYNTDFDSELEQEYMSRRKQFADSIKARCDSLSFAYLVYVLPGETDAANAHEAIDKLKLSLANYSEGTREYSILASILAYVSKVGGEKDLYMEYLTRSAISDIKGAVKENMSFREMATIMFEAGDVDRANIYLKKSIADANFYSARMRNAQSLKMLPMIDDAYASQQTRYYHRLQLMIMIISLLALGLIGALYFIRRQYRRLKVANERVAHSNEELSRLSDRLSVINADLEEKNRALNESSVIREQYTGLFMGYSAAAINALQRYHQSLRLMVNQGLSKSVLQKKLESSEFIDSTIKEFYSKFDEAILRIYPSFPEKVNSLLRKDEGVVLKPGELMNTELRIQALIRIGITDNAKIAEFLRCSITTVYTYRSKLRRRALNPDTFESSILSIN